MRRLDQKTVSPTWGSVESFMQNRRLEHAAPCRDNHMKNCNRSFSNFLQLTGVCAAIGTLALGLVTGCATRGRNAKPVYEFYPSPPDEPHLQFLMAFNSEKELGSNPERGFVSYLTGEKPREKTISKPYGIAVHGHKFYICDTDYGAVLEADLKTKRMTVFVAQGQGVLKMPLNIAIDNEGNVYVADSGRDQVVIYDKNENYVAAIGKLGEMKPRDVAVSKDRIYVADLQNHNIHVYDRTTRKSLFNFPSGSDSTNAQKRLYSPTNLALDSKGRVYVADTGGFQVQVYDADGTYLWTVGSMGDSLGQFARVKGIAVDHENRLYAVDAMSQVVQIFNEQGKLLTWFGEPGVNGRVQNLPAKVMVDYDNASYFKGFVAPDFKVEYLVVVINQLGAHMVSIYGFGHPR